MEAEWYTNTGYGHVINFLKSGRKASKKIGGITIELEGLINSSKTGLTLSINLLKASVSSF